MVDIDIVDVDTIDVNVSLVRFIETKKQLNNGRFSTSWLTHKVYLFSFLYPERYILENIALSRMILIADILKLNFSFNGRYHSIRKL